jgi:hypothetical protein
MIITLSQSTRTIHISHYSSKLIQFIQFYLNIRCEIALHYGAKLLLFKKNI